MISFFILSLKFNFFFLSFFFFLKPNVRHSLHSILLLTKITKGLRMKVNHFHYKNENNMAPEGSNPAAILTLLLNQMKLRSNNIRCILVQLVKVCFLFQLRISIATSHYVLNFSL